MMAQDDPEERVADPEHDAGVNPTDGVAATTFPSQTPGYGRRKGGQTTRRMLVLVSQLFLLVFGFAVVDYGLEREGGASSGIVWTGIAIMVVCGLIAVAIAIAFVVELTKENALPRQPGTVRLLTVSASFCQNVVAGDRDSWALTSEMEIRLDSGHTFRGSYCTNVGDQQQREWWWAAFPPERGRLRRRITPREALDAWFHVGASLLCGYSPTNPDKLLVFPFAALGDRATYDALNDEVSKHVWRNDGPDYVWFRSAT